MGLEPSLKNKVGLEARRKVFLEQAQSHARSAAGGYQDWCHLMAHASGVSLALAPVAEA